MNPGAILTPHGITKTGGALCFDISFAMPGESIQTICSVFSKQSAL